MALVFVALVGLAAATPIHELKGKALADFVNSAQKDWLADYTQAEAVSHRVGALMDIMYTTHPEDIKPADFSMTPEQLAAIPAEFDARHHWPHCESIGAIRDQANCGSCWAFAAVEAMSDRICIHSGGKQKHTLAADDPLSCCGSACGNGCKGGFPIRAWMWWVREGVVTGSGFYERAGCRPYPFEPCGTHKFHGVVHHHECKGEAATPACHKTCSDGGHTNYEHDKHHGKTAYAVHASEAAIQEEIMKNGPVEAAFTVYADFMHYRSGVYHHMAGAVEGGHAVKILGWGVENGVKYWLVANSWNTDWGLEGFFKIRRGHDECGIEAAVVAGEPKL